MEFTLQKLDTYSTTFHLAFDVRYYRAYQGFDGTRGGAKIFRPDATESYRFCSNSDLLRVYYQQTDVVSQITLLYQCQGTSNVVVKARMFANDPVIEWDVKTDEIPISYGVGKELVVSFSSKQIINDGIFYTDSNGLEMQKRTVNADSTSGLSGSFYPVTSAIALKDTEANSFEQLTVMTTRTQGASATQDGKIELIHARRLLYDDTQSKEIILNDTDIAKSTQTTY